MIRMKRRKNKEITISKKYEKRLQNGKRVKIGLYIKMECPMELKETLRFIGESSRNFYIYAGNYIAGKLTAHASISDRKNEDT